MDVDPIVDIVSIDSEITSIVSDYDVASDTPPFPRRVELLVEVTVKPKGYPTHFTAKSEILKPLF